VTPFWLTAYFSIYYSPIGGIEISSIPTLEISSAKVSLRCFSIFQKPGAKSDESGIIFPVIEGTPPPKRKCH
jgi:hypothetical protein